MLASCNKDEHQHSYTSSVTTPATCSNPGVETFTCSCGYAYTQIIPATGDHDWQVLQVYPNSCESDGWTVYECSVCHEQKQDDWTAKRDHKYEAVETVEETCTKDGYQIMQCSYCGDRYTDDQYSSEHKATGHKWIVNDDTDETIPEAVLKQLGYQAGQSDKAKEDGWGVSAAATCTTDAVYQRVCARCGKTEPKTISNSKLGHHIASMDTDGDGKDDVTLAEALKKLSLAVCKVNPSLEDAEGNKIYAFECDRENCTCNVEINAAGDTKHYVEAVAHTYTNADGSEVEWTAVPGQVADCDTAGKETRNCTVCGTPETRDVAALGHKYNTVQMDGKTPTLVCSADPILSGDVSGKDPLEEAAKVLKADCETTAEYTQRYAKLAAAYNEFTSKHEGADIAYFCVRCYEFVEAKEHSWIYSALEDGKYGLNDYEKDEDGKPVKADITADEFTCQYVEVCENCGTAKQKGAHGKITEATCRSGGYCTLCGEQRAAQDTHHYIDVTDLLDEEKENHGDNDTAYQIDATTKITYGQLRDAYAKVSATETWMVPVEGSCDTAGKDVAVCVKCLMDAANGDEFSWAPKAVETEDDYNAVTSGTTIQDKNQTDCAFTYEFEADHAYVKAYFTTNATSAEMDYVSSSNTAGRLLWENTNCAFGFKVAYICEDCGEIYKNEFVFDDPKTTTGDNADESDVNEKKLGFTDENGFLYDESTYASIKVNDNLTADDVKGVTVDTNKGAHALFVKDDYQTTNGYKAPNCTRNAIIAYSCQNCGQIVEEVYGATVDSKFATITNSGTEVVIGETTYKNVVDDKDQAPDVTKHAADTFACGTHCKATKVEGTTTVYICGALIDYVEANDGVDTELTSIAADSAYVKDAAHATTTIEYQLNADVEYLEDYTLYVAKLSDAAITEVTGDTTTYKVDWTKATLTESDKASKCATTSSTGNYTLPVAFPANTTEPKTTATYLVLKAKDGTVYPISGTFYIYNDTANTDGANAINVSSTGSPVTSVDVDGTYDLFFVGFTSASGNRPAGLPVVAVDDTSLELAFTNGKVETVGTGDNAKKVFSVEVGADIELDDPNKSLKDLFNLSKANITDVKDVYFEIDLGGHKITDSTTDRFAFEASDAKSVKFSNGTLDFTATAQALGTQYGTDGAAVSLLKPTGTTELILDKMTVKTNGSAVFAAYKGAGEGAPAPTVTITGSTITAKGAYGVATNASGITEKSGKGIINITDSKITSEDAALFVNIPSTVTVKGSELTSKSQVVVVRGGTVNLENTKLTLAAGYVDEKVTAENFTSVVGGNLAITNSSFEATDALEGYASGLTLQDYRLAGLWIDNGTAIARGAIVIGNSSANSYQYETHLSMSGVTVDNKTTGESAVPDFVVASRYAETTMMDGDKVKVMVSVTCNDNADLLAGAVITTNSIDGSITFNGAVVNK